MTRDDIFKQCGKIIRPEVNNRLMGWLWKAKVFKAMDEGTFFYIKNNSEIIGFVSCDYKKRLKLLELDKIGVLEEHRGKGVGKILLEKVKETKHNIRLDVVSENKNAIEFYKRNGFKTIGHKTLGKDPAINVTIMLYTQK